ncbi:MAG: 2-amino-4,5-dihydroxy-6-one-heptanoic acid-7-phosphate synthase [Actinobacteria bacterium 13_1_20CM_3_71_11]|nr:MAG: 2-amino-4,5-dihydroxy-6-one-heptanoic acid-7-phosphate synthase [Actinobacteria bacterium 13_1_20CM_3_71_11]
MQTLNGSAPRIGASFARELRLQRLHHHSDRLFVVPLDHAVSDGPIVPGGDLDGLLARITEHGVDAVVLHKGCLRRVSPQRLRHTSLIVHLSASTVRAPDPDAKVLVATVAEAVRLGADGVSVHVNLGSREEQRQLADLAAVAEACDRWNVPLLAMMYPRGPHTPDPRDPQLVAHAIAVAADLGADLVKTVYPGSIAAMAAVVRSAPVPVLVAGGAPGAGDEVLAQTRDALDGGAAGVAIGRGIIRADDVAATTRKIADLVHGRDEPHGSGTGVWS